jgi:hypothetical protein
VGEARQNGFKTIDLACFVFSLGYRTSELGGLLEVQVPQTVWLLWPGCAILAGVMLLERWRLWPTLVTAALAGFVVYDLGASAGSFLSPVAPLRSKEESRRHR